MRQLNFELKTLQLRHRDGVFIMRRDRSYALNQVANSLQALGFRRPRAMGLKRRQVNVLVVEWQRRRLDPGTIRGTPCRRLAALGGARRALGRGRHQRGAQDPGAALRHQRGSERVARQHPSVVRREIWTAIGMVRPYFQLAQRDHATPPNNNSNLLIYSLFGTSLLIYGSCLTVLLRHSVA